MSPQLQLFSKDPVVPVHMLGGWTKSVVDDSSSALCVLGSGSGGNSSVVRHDGAAMLIDAGFGPKTIAHRLKQAGLRLENIRAICLTHLDQDHFRPTWAGTLLKNRIPLFVHRWHLEDVQQLPGAASLWRSGLIRAFEDEPFAPLVGFTVHPIRLSHDTKGTCGFRLQTGHGDVGYATDLGYVPRDLIEHFAGVDVLALESNYDPQMQCRSGRPLFLQRRIMGKQGHLSNQQAFEAVCAVLDRAQAVSGQRPAYPRHIVLLHRSRQCNCRSLVNEVFGQDPRIAGRLTLAEQRCCTPWLSVGSGRTPSAANEQATRRVAL